MARSVEGLTQPIRKAIMKKDQNQLLKLASCDFTIGICDSDVIWSVPTTDSTLGLMEKITKIEETVDWTSGAYEFFTQDDAFFNIKSNNSEENYGFLFAKKQSRWKWVGFCTDDEAFSRRFED